MKFGTKILIIAFVLFSSIMLALSVTYLNANANFKNDFNTKIEAEIEQRKKDYKEIHSIAQQNFQKNREAYHHLHQTAFDLFVEKIRKNPEQLDKQTLLYQVKQEMVQEYGLPADSDIFLINKQKIVFASTFKPDVGLDLSIFPKTSKLIEKVFASDDIHIPNLIAKDFEFQTYHVYSYSAVDTNTLFEMSFVNREASTLFQKQFFDDASKVHTNSYNIFFEDGKYFYLKKDNQRIVEYDKASLYHKSDVHAPDSHPTDPVMQAFFDQKNRGIKQIKNQTHTSFVKLYDQNLSNMPYVNIVMESKVSTEGLDKSLALIAQIFVVTAIAFTAILVLAQFALQRYLVRPIDIITSSMDKSDLVPIARLNSHNKELFNIAQKYNTVYQKLNEEIDRNIQLSRVDALTQVPNRKAFDYAIEKLIADFNERGEEFCFALFDVDDFKSVNDTFGHVVGDNVLKTISNVAKDYISNRHSLYRFGGEEFSILMPKTSLEEAKLFLEHFRVLINSEFKQFREGSVTVSIGVSEMRKSDDFIALYERVDACLYRAKGNGKNQVCVDNE